MIFKKTLTLFAMCILLAGCATHQVAEESKTIKNIAPDNQSIKANNKSNYPTTNKDKDLEYKNKGLASWYGGKTDKFNNKKAANGEIFKNNKFTAAHKTLPMSSMLKVTNLQNNKSVVVVVNDRGPFVKGRIIDLSKIAAQTLGFEKEGLAMVEVEYIGMKKKVLG